MTPTLSRSNSYTDVTISDLAVYKEIVYSKSSLNIVDSLVKQCIMKQFYNWLIDINKS